MSWMYIGVYVCVDSQLAGFRVPSCLPAQPQWSLYMLPQRATWKLLLMSRMSSSILLMQQQQVFAEFAAYIRTLTLAHHIIVATANETILGLRAVASVSLSSL